MVHFKLFNLWHVESTLCAAYKYFFAISLIKEQEFWYQEQVTSSVYPGLTCLHFHNHSPHPLLNTMGNPKQVGVH